MMQSDRSHQATRLDAITGRYDPVLLLLTLALVGLGVVMVASSSIAIAEGLDVGPFYFVTRHAVFMLAGVGLAWSSSSRARIRSASRAMAPCASDCSARSCCNTSPT